jgi:hypothetical protein
VLWGNKYRRHKNIIIAIAIVIAIAIAIVVVWYA